MNAPVRITIIYGVVVAILLWPITGMLAGPLGWSAAFKLMLWANLSGYALFLVHWSRRRKAAPLFPLALLLTIALWPGIYGVFFFMALGVLSWIRSGICFHRTPFRAVIAETITICGGVGLVAALNPGTAVTWSLSIWLFVLIQSLYFFIVPSPVTVNAGIAAEDPFERACRKVKRILDG